MKARSRRWRQRNALPGIIPSVKKSFNVAVLQNKRDLWLEDNQNEKNKSDDEEDSNNRRYKIEKILKQQSSKIKSPLCLVENYLSRFNSWISLE